ncbi:MAG: extracellular solute-binding protein [Candidatus Heimdallarchaeaceae archaeon]
MPSKKVGLIITVSLITLIVIGGSIYLSLREQKTTLLIFHAGSLSNPIKLLVEAFEERNLNVKIQTEGAGSSASIRKITDQGRLADILFSADYSLIDTMMINSNPQWANWSIVFAKNSIVIAYTQESKYSAEITSENWFSILNKSSDVIVGRSNPADDPCGYRTLLTIKLASLYYNDSSLWANLLSHPSFQTHYASNEMLMVSPLEMGELDYAFLYESMAKQYNLSYITLPEEINLGNKTFESFYQRAKVYFDTTTGELKEGSGEGITEKTGKAIYYGVTIPLNAPNYDLALSFVEFTISQQGLDIIENKSFQPVLNPPETRELSLLPLTLQSYVKSNPNL